MINCNKSFVSWSFVTKKIHIISENEANAPNHLKSTTDLEYKPVESLPLHYWKEVKARLPSGLDMGTKLSKSCREIDGSCQDLINEALNWAVASAPICWFNVKLSASLYHIKYLVSKVTVKIKPDQLSGIRCFMANNQNCTAIKNISSSSNGYLVLNSEV